MSDFCATCGHKRDFHDGTDEDVCIVLRCGCLDFVEHVERLNDERLSLPKRSATELARDLVVRADALTGEAWERTATANMMREAAAMISACICKDDGNGMAVYSPNCPNELHATRGKRHVQAELTHAQDTQLVQDDPLSKDREARIRGNIIVVERREPMDHPDVEELAAAARHAKRQHDAQQAAAAKTLREAAEAFKKAHWPNTSLFTGRQVCDWLLKRAEGCEPDAQTCANGHTQRTMGCVSCVMLFDWPRSEGESR